MTDNTKFITIEGIDGSGKSSFIPEIKKMFEEMGEHVVLTREPGGTYPDGQPLALAERLREEILNTEMDSGTELLLAFAARREHLMKVIRPSLEEGNVVISDRFTDSTYAYQGYAKNMNLNDIAYLEKMVQEELTPGLTLIFTVPVEISKERLSWTGKTPDKFESQNEEFFLKAIEGYHARAVADPERCKLIDSSKGKEYTREQVMKHMNDYFSKQVKKNRNRNIP